MILVSVIWGKRLCWVLFLYPCLVAVEPSLTQRLQGYLFDMNQSSFIPPAFWKPFIFSFSFCPNFIHYVSQTHTALSAFCCWCRWLFTAWQQIAFSWVLLHQTSMKRPHTLMHIHIYTHSVFKDYSCFCVTLFLCIVHCFHLCFFISFHCWQQNGTSRFHGLASLDDIHAIISTPPLGGFQVATPTPLIWSVINLGLRLRLFFIST